MRRNAVVASIVLALVCGWLGGVMTFREQARAERDCGQHRGSGERPRIELHEMDMDDSDIDDAQVFQLVSKM